VSDGGLTASFRVPLGLRFEALCLYFALRRGGRKIADGWAVAWADARRQFAAIVVTFAILLQSVASAAAIVALGQMQAGLPSSFATTTALPTKAMRPRPPECRKTPTLTAYSASPGRVTPCKRPFRA
jgi:hypothetical protein